LLGVVLASRQAILIACDIWFASMSSQLFTASLFTLAGRPLKDLASTRLVPILLIHVEARRFLRVGEGSVGALRAGRSLAVAQGLRSLGDGREALFLRRAARTTS
jgi:hypothetical protein